MTLAMLIILCGFLKLAILVTRIIANAIRYVFYSLIHIVISDFLVQNYSNSYDNYRVIQNKSPLLLPEEIQAYRFF